MHKWFFLSLNQYIFDTLDMTLAYQMLEKLELRKGFLLVLAWQVCLSSCSQPMQ